MCSCRTRSIARFVPYACVHVGLDPLLTLKCVLTPAQPWWMSTRSRVQWESNVMPGRLHFYLFHFSLPLLPLILWFLYLFYSYPPPPSPVTFLSLYLSFPSFSCYLFHLTSSPLTSSPPPIVPPSSFLPHSSLIPHVCLILPSALMLKCVRPTKGGGWKEN